MKKYKVIKAIDIGNIRYSPGIVANEEMDIVKFLKENNLVDEYLEEVEPKLSYKPFNPKEEEDYFYVDTWGLVLSSVHYVARFNLPFINLARTCFRTKEEAEYYRDWLIARKRIMDSLDFDSSWENPKQEKWTICYDHAIKCLKIISWSYYQYSSLPPYKSEEEAKQAIQDLEDEYLVYYGIKRSLNE